ncbi:DUF1311 domain-containing protein [Methylomonas sp. LW13]|uniref:Lysozyme inhibitor LprI family protein n=1 Tax=Methylomonas defluvii TaxID=3045149 RepID=A0ABU4UF70_9GAMM|nr:MULTISPECIES: lysozyme inhibitor LprI family protein [unclassified Methylomonas]MDX8127989.1 lysozyme inhibitor LprI family protein [Methylomonas sp. OY6]PKD39543.1 DUF1311 domain-containing protein [Methylomonas sp. Kb3]QBC28819.1 DUF1311 domain-containing protein [Methylomonas sp. LW13]
MCKGMMFLVFVLAAFPVVVLADDVNLSDQYKKCVADSGGVTNELLGCISTETEIQDARLNKAYKSAMTGIEKQRVKALQEAQRAWLKYRDANCGFYADPDGGTSAAINSNECIVSETGNRAKELEIIAGSRP